MKKIMCLGDSITHGDDKGGYRPYLAALLAGAGIDCTFVGSQNLFGMHEGYPGFTIKAVIEGGAVLHWSAPPLETTLTKYTPDCLLIMVGTNDMYSAHPADAFATLKQLIERTWESLPKASLFVGSILPVAPGYKPWDSTVPDDVTTRIPEYNGMIAGYIAALQDHGTKIDFVDIYRTVSSTNELGPDGVHPQHGVYKVMAHAWFEAMKCFVN